MAELEKSTISERMTLGRDRVARTGKWFGAVPYGYDVDAEGLLAPSARLVPAVRLTEAALMTDAFARVAAGSTAMREVLRLNALGVAPERRYPSGAVVRLTTAWSAARLTDALHNPVYKGVAVLKSQHGPIERAVPALVSPETWEQVQRQLTQNRSLSKKNARRDYLLRGLVKCGACGCGYTGGATRNRAYYRCTSQLGGHGTPARPACAGKRVRAAWLEAEVWKDCAAFIRDPGEALAAAQQQLRARLAETASREGQRQGLQRQIAEQEQERARADALPPQPHPAGRRRARVGRDQP
jgi:site-specific DNA recombinase